MLRQSFTLLNATPIAAYEKVVGNLVGHVGHVEKITRAFRRTTGLRRQTQWNLDSTLKRVEPSSQNQLGPS